MSSFLGPHVSLIADQDAHADVSGRIAELEAANAAQEEINADLQAQLDQLRGWYQAARTDLDRVLKLLDSWSADE